MPSDETLDFGFDASTSMCSTRSLLIPTVGTNGCFLRSTLLSSTMVEDYYFRGWIVRDGLKEQTLGYHNGGCESANVFHLGSNSRSLGRTSLGALSLIADGLGLLDSLKTMKRQTIQAGRLQ